MSEQNKTLTRRFYEEVFNKKNLDTVNELCAPGFVDHNAMPGQGPGPNGLKDWFRQFFEAFPDMKATIDEMVAERDLVVTRLTCEGTHKGEFMGAAPTGRKVSLHGMDMVRIKDGRATEVWHQGDDVVVLMELGVRVPTHK
jgi:steroid delta-isomerase-like uncharacterized protein